ncbi:MAG TPA: SCP2 sterol-binding domain-containing protein [Acidimicrobiales bacterium]|nr:SCP2 sterol-binding domain-containing protein [Acidimicrobiales bacterium]
MSRFLSHEWVDAFNQALARLVLPGPGDGAGLAVADGPVTVAEDIQGGPEGDVRLLLHIDRGTLRLERPAEGDGGVASTEEAGRGHRRPEVTIALSYRDAAAMSAGELSPAEALNEGRVRVRGDLTVLVEAQKLLAAARSCTGELAASTTY